MSEKQSRLEKLIEMNGYTTEKILDKFDISISTYKRYIKKPSCIPTKTLIELSELFNVNSDYILGRTDIRLPIKKIKDMILNHGTKKLNTMFFDANDSNRVSKSTKELLYWKKTIRNKLDKSGKTLRDLMDETGIRLEILDEYINKPQTTEQVKTQHLAKIIKALDLKMDIVLRVNTPANDITLRNIAKKANGLSPKYRKYYIRFLVFLFHVDNSIIKNIHTNNKIHIDDDKDKFHDRVNFLRKNIGYKNHPGLTQKGLARRIEIFYLKLYKEVLEELYGYLYEEEGEEFYEKLYDDMYEELREEYDLIPCSDETIQNIEKPGNPDMKYIWPMSGVWNIPIDYLTGISDNNVDLSRFEEFYNNYATLTENNKKLIEKLLKYTKKENLI